MENDLDPREFKGDQKNKILNRIVYPPGKTIIKQGDEAYRAYYIEKGVVEVIIEDGHHELKVSELVAGDIFGEMALINEEPRSATVRAVETCTLSVVSKAEIEKRVEKLEDRAIRALIKVLVRRLDAATKSQMIHYKGLADFQDRITGIVDRVDLGISDKKRDAFREEINPLLDKVQAILDKYQN